MLFLQSAGAIDTSFEGMKFEIMKEQTKANDVIDSLRSKVKKIEAKCNSSVSKSAEVHNHRQSYKSKILFAADSVGRSASVRENLKFSISLHQRIDWMRR